MYINKIRDIIKKITMVDIADIESDIRNEGVDSISFIKILAEIEEYFNIEFDYFFIDEYKVISLKVLNSQVEKMIKR